jgi:hypothetical protein
MNKYSAKVKKVFGFMVGNNESGTYGKCPTVNRELFYLRTLKKK